MDTTKVIFDLLCAEGYTVVSSRNGPSGLALSLAERPDLILLDLVLPGILDLEVCRNIRLIGYEGSILMLTGLEEVEHRIRVLRAGADDCLVKPVNLAELMVRIEVLLRRTGVAAGLPAPERIEFGNIVADFSNFTVTKSGEILSLSTKEMELLRLLLEHRKQVVSRTTILEKVWKENLFVSPRTVDVHIAWLRRKIEEYPEKPRYIATIRGEGYRFCG